MDVTDELYDVGVENTSNLLDAFEKFSDVKEFMHAHLFVGLHSTTVSYPHRFLTYMFDVDGLVIEFDKVRGLLGGLHHIFLPRFKVPVMKPHYQMLKKHEDLTTYSPDGICALKNAVGHTLGYVDGGYYLLLTVVPANKTAPDTRLFRKDLYNIVATDLLNEVTDNFRQLLKNLSPKDMSRPTIQKQVSHDTTNYHVLLQDRHFILDLLDQALEKANSCYFIKVKVFLNQFGQKNPEQLEVSELADLSSVRSLSVHTACKIVARDPDTHVLFSRFGLQDIAGIRGTLFSTLGMHEATNFQTNLDHTGLDVTEELRGVLGTQGKLTFLQLYADSPHAYVQMPFKHPVTGAIVTCGLSHPNYQTSLISRATTYLNHMRDLGHRLVCQLGCRIEQVVRFEDEIPMLIDTSHYTSSLRSVLSFCHLRTKLVVRVCSQFSARSYGTSLTL